MIKRKVLSNGMTVIFKERKNGVVSVAFAVRFGAINEKEEHKGIAHFIEHMLYKGTPTRNTHKISSEIEKNGGELNGFTSESVTAFWCKMPSRHLGVALDVLSDMVKNPLFDEEEVDKERQVIFEEMKMYQDNPRMHVFDKIKEQLYKGDFALPVIGTTKSMNSNSRQRLKDFFDKVYIPKNMILAVVGDADFDYICKYAQDNFSDKKGDKISYPNVEEKNGENIEKRTGIDQANLVFAHHVPLGEENDYTAQVLITLLAGGMSSRLFSEIREKRNLAYAVKGFHESESKFSYSGIYIGTTPENVDKVKELIIKEYDKVSKELDEEELESVKEQIIGNYFISMEDSHSVMIDLLTNEIKGNALEADKFVENIRAVKLENVKKMAKLKSWSMFALVPA